MFSLFLIVAVWCSVSGAEVSLDIVDGSSCPGDNLTFHCEATEASLPVTWTLRELPGYSGTANVAGRTLNNDVERITSTDMMFLQNPSNITILNVTENDNNASVQCGNPDSVLSRVIKLSIRPLECLLTVNATAKSDTSITVELMWTNCKDAEPSSIFLRLSPATAQDPIVINGVTKVINGLKANTAYSIIASFSDACGNISTMAEVTTLQTTESTIPSTTFTPTLTPSPSDMSGGNGGNDNITEGTPPPPRIDVIIGCVAAGLIAVALIVIIAVVAVLIFKHMKKNQTHGEKLATHHGEEMADMHEDTTYAAPDKDKAAVEGEDGGGVYSYAATTTVVGAKHGKPGAKPGGEKKVADDVSAQPEKPMRGSKKQPPLADVPHKQGPVGDLYAMPDKKAPEVGHKSGPQGDMYAVAAKPSKGGYGAEGPN